VLRRESMLLGAPCRHWRSAVGPGQPGRWDFESLLLEPESVTSVRDLGDPALPLDAPCPLPLPKRFNVERATTEVARRAGGHERAVAPASCAGHNVVHVVIHVGIEPDTAPPAPSVRESPNASPFAGQMPAVRTRLPWQPDHPQSLRMASAGATTWRSAVDYRRDGTGERVRRSPVPSRRCSGRSIPRTG
jgi:hypothetical protein